MIASKDDKAGHHMFWVSMDGDVSLDMIPEDMTPVEYAKSLEDGMQFRLETMQEGNDYVGPQAAKDQKWTDRVFRALMTNFKDGVRGYIDVY